MHEDLGTKKGCTLSDRARMELLNKQVCCYRMDEKSKKQVFVEDALSFLTLIFPDFKVVKSDFNIYPGESFIYIGDMKWIPKIQKRPEPHVIVATTGEFDLTDRKQICDLVYLHHNKKPYKYVEELLDPKTGWTDDQFWYNMRILWVTGELSSRELLKNDLFLKIITTIKSPLELIPLYLKTVDELGPGALKFIENNLLRFIKNSRNPDSNTKKGMLDLMATFKYNYGPFVQSAIQKLLDSPIDDQELKLLDFLLDLSWPSRRD